MATGIRDLGGEPQEQVGALTRDICLILPTVRDLGSLRAYLQNARRHRFDLSRTHTLLITEDSCDRGPKEALLREEGLSGEVFDHGAAFALDPASGDCDHGGPRFSRPIIGIANHRGKIYMELRETSPRGRP